METASNTSESGNLVEKEAKAAEEQIEAEAPPAKEENTEVESKPDVKEEKETKTEATASKKKKNRKKKNKKKIIITEEDFGPEVDFTKQEGFVYDPQKAEFGIDEVQLKKRPWLIQIFRASTQQIGSRTCVGSKANTETNLERREFALMEWLDF